MIYLPDVNVWIALAAERHIHHEVARRWFAGLGNEKLTFCRITQLGFLRLLSNRHVMQEEVMKPDEAWRIYDLFRLDRRVGYMREPDALPEVWRTTRPSQPSSPNLWTDAYLCALCRSVDLTLVTFDTKIPPTEDVRCLILP